MGRAIVREPQVFLMDEPLSNLDAKMRVSTRTEIAAMQRRLGVTTVYVTHDQVEAMTMGDRVALLKDGALQQFATPAELYDKPANVFVAGFIGSPAMNLFTLPVGAEGVRIGSSDLALPGSLRSRISSAGLDTITLGIRPEQWAVGGDNGDGAGGVKAQVDVVEELGSDAFLYAHLDDENQTPVVVRSAGRSGARRGDQIALTPTSEDLHLFNPETGERL
jgi:multiple sugar transport system ATP-binding protein